MINKTIYKRAKTYSFKLYKTMKLLMKKVSKKNYWFTF